MSAATLEASSLQTLCDAVSGPVMMGHLQEFARWVKLSGTPDELSSLRTVQARLDEYGYRTRIIFHDAYISLPGAARVTIDGQALTAITHSHGQASPVGGVTGRLVDLGEGKAADFARAGNLAGCIVLAEGIASPAVARLASAAGAVGQLHISPHHHLHEMCVSPVWGSPTDDTIRDMPSTVVCTISQADGMALVARLQEGAAPVVTLTAAVDTGWRKTPILEGVLDGPTPGGPFVLLSGHHDTWYYGVMDNGSANATMLESARLMAQAPDRKRELRVCFWSGHSHGRYSGSTWYVDQNWDEFDRLCVAHVNVDSTGGMGATVLGDAAAVSELSTLAGEAIRTQTGHQHVGKRKNRSSDDSLPGVGVPSMFGALSEQPLGPVKMRNALGWWWHTPEDLIDKVDIDFLIRDTKVFVHVLSRLLGDAVVPLDYTAHARALLEELETIAASLGDRFDCSGLIAGTHKLAALAEALAAAGGADPARANTALMAASRALVPIDYSRGDRFDHDPALPLPPWPVLQKLRDLAATAPGSDAAHFTEVSAVRSRNRVAHALRQANAALVSGLPGAD
jgi:hypothetical protein